MNQRQSFWRFSASDACSNAATCDQTIWVLEGVGLCQREGGPIEVIRPGDRVFFEPGETHWHGACATRFMAHLAMLQVEPDAVVAPVGRHLHVGGDEMPQHAHPHG